MSISVSRGKADETIEKIVTVFRDYESSHSDARIDVYRQNLASIRVRIIDPNFDGLARSERYKIIEKVLDSLPEDVAADISMLVLLTPSETNQSIANIEFENPVPSGF